MFKQFLHFLVRFEWFHLYSLGQFKCHFCNHDEMPKVATFNFENKINLTFLD